LIVPARQTIHFEVKSNSAIREKSTCSKVADQRRDVGGDHTPAQDAGQIPAREAISHALTNERGVLSTIGVLVPALFYGSSSARARDALGHHRDPPQAERVEESEALWISPGLV